MLAYIFWHEPADTSAEEYERRLAGFHAALRSSPPAGFISSAAYAVAHAPWVPGKAGYEDWYRVDDFTALGALNDAAVSGSRKKPHDDAARFAAWGTAGLYRLVRGAPVDDVRCCGWLQKPGRESYESFYTRLEPVLSGEGVELWQRQMTLGPATEFCFRAREWCALPRELEPLIADVRRVV